MAIDVAQPLYGQNDDGLHIVSRKLNANNGFPHVGLEIQNSPRWRSVLKNNFWGNHVFEHAYRECDSTIQKDGAHRIFLLCSEVRWSLVAPIGAEKVRSHRWPVLVGNHPPHYSNKLVIDKWKCIR